MRLVRVAAAAVMLTLLSVGPAMAGIVVDLSVLKSDAPDPVAPGANLLYTISVNNAGPLPAGNVSLSDTLPAGTTFVSFTSPVGWTNTTPPVGGTGTVTSTIASLPAGLAAFTLTVQVGAGVANGTVITNTATVASSDFDPTPANNSSTATTTVSVPVPSAAASVPNAAMGEPVTGAPPALLGFGAVLVLLLLATAKLAAARSRT